MKNLAAVGLGTKGGRTGTGKSRAGLCRAVIETRLGRLGVHVLKVKICSHIDGIVVSVLQGKRTTE